MKANNCYFIFASYSESAGASDVLIRSNINNKIVKAPVSFRSCCSFAVVVPFDSVETCEYIFMENNIFPLMKKFM